MSCMVYAILFIILKLRTRKSKYVVVQLYWYTGYLVIHIISEFVFVITVSSLYIHVDWYQPTSGLVIVMNLIIDLGLYYLHQYWVPIRSTHSLVHWYIFVTILGSYNTINIFDHLYLGNSHFIDVYLSQCYMCDTNNLISIPGKIFVTHNLLLNPYRK